jgi:hypothetical protein
MLLGKTGSFAAATVSHPAPMTASNAEVVGTIFVAQRRRGGRRRGRSVAIIADPARANERRYDDYNDRPRRAHRRRGRSGENRCADQFW